MVFKPGDILYEGFTRTVTYNNALPGPPGMFRASFNQKMQAYWNQLKEQILLADELLRNQQTNSDPKTEGGATDDPSATTTDSNPDTPDGTVEGTPDATPGKQQGNKTSPTPATPSQGAGPSSSNTGKSSSTNSSDQNGSATP